MKKRARNLLLELLSAAERGDAPGIGAAVDAGARVDGFLPEEGLTALMIAAATGREDCIRALGRAGARLDKASPGEAPALHRAVESGQTWAALCLLRLGADPNAKCPDGLAPLHRAAKFGDATAARALIEAGAEVSVYDGDGFTPWRVARQEGFENVVDALEGALGRRAFQAELRMELGEGKLGVGSAPRTRL